MNISSAHGGEKSLERTAGRTVEELRRVRARTESVPDRIAYMHALPDEIISKIIGSLSLSELASCHSVDRRFRGIASDLVKSANVEHAETLTHVMFAFRRLETFRLEIDETTRQNEVFSAFWKHSLFNKPRMRELIIMGNHSITLTARAMRYLAYASSLTSLEIRFIRVGTAALKQLQYLPNLRSLELLDVPLDDSRLEFLEHIPEMESLTLSDCNLEDLSQVGNVSKLRRLRVDGSDLTDAALDQIKELSRLEELQLDQVHVQGSGFADLSCAGELRSLTWHNDSLSDDEFRGGMVLQHLAKFKSLETLNLGPGMLDDFDDPDRIGLSPLRNMAKLKHVQLVGIEEMLDSDLAHVASLPDVEDIDLSSSEGFTPAGLATLLAMPSLRKLDLTDTEFEGLAAELRGKYPHRAIIC